MFKLMKVHWKQATVVDPGPTCLEMSFCGTAWTVLGWIGFNMHVAAKADLTCRPECFINLSHVVMCIYVYTVYGVCMYIYIYGTPLVPTFSMKESSFTVFVLMLYLLAIVMFCDCI